MRDKMVQQAKSFIKNNFMELVLAAMFSAFWVQYNEDQKTDAEFRKNMVEKTQRLNDRQMVVAHVLYYDKDTQPFFKDIVFEWIKSETRGQ